MQTLDRIALRDWPLPKPGDASDKEDRGQVLLTPHAGEMAHLSGQPKDDVLAKAPALAQRMALKHNAVIALEGATTCIAAPEGESRRHVSANAGLGASGSGDVLAGSITGLAARPWRRRRPGAFLCMPWPGAMVGRAFWRGKSSRNFPRSCAIFDITAKANPKTPTGKSAGVLHWPAQSGG